MHVTKKRHQTIVSILTGALIALCLIIFFSYLGIGAFRLELVNEDSTSTNPPIVTEAPDSPFLQDQEVVIIEVTTTTEDKEKVIEEITLPVERVLFEYVEVTNGCGIQYEGECLNVRSGPGTEYDIVASLRNGIVLKVGGKVERDDEIWYKIVFDEWLRYPERVKEDWYLSADYVAVLLDEGDKTAWDNEHGTTSKRIVIDRNTQTLTAYDGDKIFMETNISTGRELTPTPRGTFSIFKKTPSRYMQGPIPNIAEQFYDMPGVPWNLYFTHDGAVIHGAYWHDSFGSQYSHGCVNVRPDDARTLYNWAVLGTKVIVK